MAERPSHLAAREVTLRAYALQGSPQQVAEALEGASEVVLAGAAGPDPGASGERWRYLGLLLRLTARLYRWDAAVRSAETDADRHLRAARREAETVHREFDVEPHLSERHGSVLAVLAELNNLTSPNDIETVRSQVARICLPTRVIPPRRSYGGGGRSLAPERPPEDPRVVCLFYLDGALIEGPVRVRPGKIHQLDLLARVLHWPETHNRLKIEFVSVWGPATIEAPALKLSRPDGASTEALAVEAKAQLLLRATSEQPITLTTQAELEGDDVSPKEVAVLGYSQLAVRPFDPTLDAITGAEAIDERLHDVYAELRGKVPDDELGAFARFYNAITRAAQAIQGDNVFRKGQKVSEADFQEEMERRLKADPSLGGDVQRVHKAGGITDLTHAGITCELKVETKSIELEDISSYVGQPVQYASGTQKQLSLICVLDMSPKAAPPGSLASNIALHQPQTSGGSNAYVGAMIIPGNLDVPSAWSARRVEQRPV